MYNFLVYFYTYLIYMMKTRKNKSRKNKSKKGGTLRQQAPITICAICKKKNVDGQINGYKNVNNSIKVCSNGHTFHFRCVCNRTHCPTCKKSMERFPISVIHSRCKPTDKEDINALLKKTWTDVWNDFVKPQ